MGTAENFTDNFLEHYGVKGMKWGVRRDRAARAAAAGGKPLEFKRMKPKGGSGKSMKRSTPPPSADKKEMIRVQSKVNKKSGTSALSNNELKKLNERMRLEQEYSRLSENANTSKGRAFIRDFIKQDVNNVKQTGNIQNTRTAQIAKALGKTASAANEIRGDVKTYNKYKKQAQNR